MEVEDHILNDEKVKTGRRKSDAQQILGLIPDTAFRTSSRLMVLFTYT